MAAEPVPPADRLFPRNRRLLTKKSYDRVFQEGRKIVRPSLVLFIHRREDSDPARLGTAISRKVGKAHDRNRIKRRLREIFRLNRFRMKVSCDVVVVARPSAREADYARLREEFLSGLEKGGVLLNPGHNSV